MTIDFMAPKNTWIVDSINLTDFLDYVFTNDEGEIWLYNSDLKVITNPSTFEDLYRKRIAGTHKDKIKAVKIFVRKSLLEDGQSLKDFLKNFPGLIDNLKLIAKMKGGKERLSTFYFGIADDTLISKENRVDDTVSNDDTWVFYARGPGLNSGIVMLRHRSFPFQLNLHRTHPTHNEGRFAIVWKLKHHSLLQERLADEFANRFVYLKGLQRLEVIDTESFNFKLINPTQGANNNSNTPLSFSLGDEADVGIICAKSEEMKALKLALEANDVPFLGIPKCEKGYESFSIITNTGETKQVVMTVLNDQGCALAAVRTSDMIRTCNPKHIILTGVAGSNPEKTEINLGDVVIGLKVFGYDQGEFREGKFNIEHIDYLPDDLLYGVAIDDQTKKIWEKSIEKIKTEKPENKNIYTQAHHDLFFASGSSLISDPEFFVMLHKSYSKKIQVAEMEAAGVCCAAGKMKRNVLVVKGIMDRRIG